MNRRPWRTVYARPGCEAKLCILRCACARTLAIAISIAARLTQYACVNIGGHVRTYYIRTRSGCGCSGCRQGALRWRLSDLSDQGMTVKQNRMQSCMRSAVITVFIVAVSYLPLCECALVSQSSIAMCNHGDSSEPTGEGGNPCEKKMLVSMTLRGGQVAASCMRSLPMW